MTGLVLRLTAVARALFATHVDQARRELKDDTARIVAGLVFVVLAVVFLTVTFLLVDIGAVLMLHDIARLEWWGALLVVTGANALIALVCGLVGRARLSRPVLVETRALATRTVGILRGTSQPG